MSGAEGGRYRVLCFFCQAAITHQRHQERLSPVPLLPSSWLWCGGPSGKALQGRAVPRVQGRCRSSHLVLATPGPEQLGAMCFSHFLVVTCPLGAPPPWNGQQHPVLISWGVGLSGFQDVRTVREPQLSKGLGNSCELWLVCLVSDLPHLPFGVECCVLVLQAKQSLHFSERN